MSTTDDLLRNAEAYAASFDKGELPLPPAKKVAVVACMDARLIPTRVLGLEEGDAHVIRNAGALVTDDVKRSLETSRKLGTERVILMLHTDCGARSGDLDALAREAAAEIGGDARATVYDVDSRELRDAAQDDRSRG